MPLFDNYEHYKIHNRNSIADNWMSSEISFSAGASDPQHYYEKAIGGSNLE